jgi:hypothetical protein
LIVRLSGDQVNSPTLPNGRICSGFCPEALGKPAKFNSSVKEGASRTHRRCLAETSNGRQQDQPAYRRFDNALLPVLSHSPGFCRPMQKSVKKDQPGKPA